MPGAVKYYCILISGNIAILFCTSVAAVAHNEEASWRNAGIGQRRENVSVRRRRQRSAAKIDYKMVAGARKCRADEHGGGVEIANVARRRWRRVGVRGARAIVGGRH